MTPRVGNVSAPVRERVQTKSPRRASVPRLRFGYLHPMSVQLIKQVRPVRDEGSITDLADSMATIGMLEPPMIAELSPDHIQAYLDHFNQALGSNHTVAELAPDIKTGCYYIVVFGHRRTKGHRLLWTDGCSKCQMRPRGARSKTCVQCHDTLDSRGMKVRIYHNIDPALALKMQIAENTQEPVSREANAESLRIQWEIARRLDPTLSKTAFARELNQSAQTVTDALAFTELPDEVKKACTAKHLPFTAAVELARLTVAGFSDEAVIRHMMHVKSAAKKTAEIRAYVTAQLVMRSQVGPEDLMLISELVDDGLDVMVGDAARRQAVNAAQSRLNALRVTCRAMSEGMLPSVNDLRTPEVARIMKLGDRLEEQLVK